VWSTSTRSSAPAALVASDADFLRWDDVAVRLRLGPPTINLQVFLSSGDDLKALRDLVSKLANEAVNEMLNRHELPVRLQVGRWELSTPHRVAGGQTVNTEFVEKARATQLLLCLLHEELGDGTREELEAALGQGNVEIAVIWCVDDNHWPMTPAGQWLHDHKDELFIDRAGAPDTTGPVTAIVRACLDAAFTVLQQVETGEPPHEQR
jgi:hypothetical protein